MRRRSSIIGAIFTVLSFILFQNCSNFGSLGLRDSSANTSSAIARSGATEKRDQSALAASPTDRQSFLAMLLSRGNEPFSFQVNGADIHQLLSADWGPVVRLLGETSEWSETEYKYLQPGGPLQIRVVIKSFKAFSAIEYHTFVKNIGNTSAQINDLRSRMVLKNAAGNNLTLHYAAGNAEGPVNADGSLFMDYQPLVTQVSPSQAVTLGPKGGRSSDTVLPYFNVAWNSGGVVLALGWTGQWRSLFSVDSAKNAIVDFGLMDATRFALQPGDEELQLPSMLFSFWTGDLISGQNDFRRLLMSQFLPLLKDGKNLPVSFASADCTSANAVSEPQQLGWMDAIKNNQLGYDTYWMDAGWYSSNRTSNWDAQVGNWFTPPSGNILNQSNRSRADGMKYLLWFEPERAAAGTDIMKECPSCFLSAPASDPKATLDFLLDLGSPASLAYASNRFNGLIDQYGVDIFRHDFNVDPLAHWRAKDAASGKYGLSELRHVQGLYRFWENLTNAHPGLVIDSCASGGRRLDFETLKRTLPLYRTDGKLNDPIDTAIRKQGMSYGLSLWAPVPGSESPIPAKDSLALYKYRSSLSATMYFVDAPTTNSSCTALGAERTREVLSEYKELQKLLLGDFYPLTDLTAVSASSYGSEYLWMSSQYHRPDLDEGMILSFRRNGASETTQTYPLRGLNAGATYLVVDLDRSSVKEQSGSALMQTGVNVTVDTPGASSLILYFSQSAYLAPNELIRAYRSVFGRYPSVSEIKAWIPSFANVVGNPVKFQNYLKSVLAKDLASQAAVLKSAYRALTGDPQRPAASEIQAWTSVFTAGSPSYQLVFEALKESLASQPLTRGVITYSYTEVFGRQPLDAEVHAWLEVDSKSRVTLDILMSNLKKALAASTPDQESAITKAYQDGFGRSPSESEFTAWKVNLRAGATGYREIRDQIARSLSAVGT